MIDQNVSAAIAHITDNARLAIILLAKVVLPRAEVNAIEISGIVA